MTAPPTPTPSTGYDPVVARLLDADARHVWHPYDSMPSVDPCRLVESAEGARLRVRHRDGGAIELIDAMSSWWAAVWGYRHPVLVDAVRRQAHDLSHVMFGGLTHAPAIDLCERLVAATPAGLDHVFLSDSGSIAVEVAIKMCLQFWRSRGRTSKHRLLTWRGGYHGDTFGAMSVCDPEGGMHRLWSDVVASQVFVERPADGVETPVDPSYAEQCQTMLHAHIDEVAAVIVEPVVQGAGGMRFHSPALVSMWRGLCDEADVLLVLDEIATGFGRTGTMFAADHVGVVPDVMCVGKALTGGMATLGATLCTGRVAEGISAGEVPVLAHGPTFMGNPLACAVANASLDLFDRGEWPSMVTGIGDGLRRGLAAAARIPGVRDVRVLGGIGVIETESTVDVAAATEAAVSHGVWIRPFRNLLYTMPPYVCTAAEVDDIAGALVAAAGATCDRRSG
ncbi:MAG: adenosylmethionine--8-amino-7-oxononanoate transaminase [Microthrixaceae bacterium]